MRRERVADFPIDTGDQAFAREASGVVADLARAVRGVGGSEERSDLGPKAPVG